MTVPIDFRNLTTFILQYVVATLAAGYLFHALWSRRFSLRHEFIVHRPASEAVHQFELLGHSFYSSLEKAVKSIVTPLTVLFSGQVRTEIPSTDLRTEFRLPGAGIQNYYYIQRKKSDFKAPSTRVKFPELYYRKSIYDAFVSFFSISVWAAIVLLLTPYQKIFVFIPHFANNNLNLAIVILFAITVFESGIATLYMHIGTSRRVVLLTMLAVLGIFSASLLTPSFAWFRGYTNYGEIILFVIVGVLILSVTFLISLFRDKNILYRLALYSSFVSYGFFIAVTTYNILGSILFSVT